MRRIKETKYFAFSSLIACCLLVGCSLNTGETSADAETESNEAASGIESTTEIRLLASLDDFETDDENTAVDDEPSAENTNPYGWGILADSAYDGIDLKDYFTAETFPRINGSTATLPLSWAIYSYTTGEPREVAESVIVHSKTTQAYLDLIKGKCDILLVYEPSQSVIDAMEEQELMMKPVGLDALVFMANTDNPVQSLSLEQLQDIYAGAYDNWSEVGGNDQPLYAFQRPVGSGSQTLMEKLVMGDRAMEDNDNVYHYATMEGILEAMLTYNGENNTLGYSVYYYARNMFYHPELRFVGVNGVVPSSETIYKGEYPLNNPFYAVIRADEPEECASYRLFDWLTSDEAQQLVMDEGYVPAVLPKGATFEVAQHEATQVAEVLTKKPMPEDTYFVFYNKVNTMDQTGQVDYGNLTIFDSDWTQKTVFYNVVPDYNSLGFFEGRYISFAQIRMTPDGGAKEFYGIYDLEKEEYTILPQENKITLLDSEHNYFTMKNAVDYSQMVIDPYENILVDGLDAIWSRGPYFCAFSVYDSKKQSQYGYVFDWELKLIDRFDAFADNRFDEICGPEEDYYFRDVDELITIEDQDDGTVMFDVDGNELAHGDCIWNMQYKKSWGDLCPWCCIVYGEEVDNGSVTLLLTKDGKLAKQIELSDDLFACGKQCFEVSQGNDHVFYNYDGEMLLRYRPVVEDY